MRHDSTARLAARLGMMIVLVCSGLAHASGPPLIETDKGKLEGQVSSDGKVISFKAIPYAAPPLEDLRWKAPQPVTKWKKVRPALEFGARCIQSARAPGTVFRDSGESEDCLTLNVWGPAGLKHGGLPVMVLIHGGGFRMGGSSEMRQDGEAMARHNVIVVSMNYRLGIFGFLALPELASESGHGGSGNYGLMDQAAALLWVKHTISVFGGDPENITIVADASDPSTASVLSASPLAKQFATKAVDAAGAPLRPSPLRFATADQAETEDQLWADRTFGTGRVFYLRTVRVDELLKAATSNTAPSFLPVFDGFALPAPQ